MKPIYMIYTQEPLALHPVLVAYYYGDDEGADTHARRIVMETPGLMVFVVTGYKKV